VKDLEFDIIDELYFVTSFPDLLKALDLPEEELVQNLHHLFKQGYVKAFYPDTDTEVELNEEQFSKNFKHYFFLATKTGLIMHNTR
jgi:hypothetical protein